MPPQQQQPKIHPPYTHSLSPTISRWVPLRASDIHLLTTHGIYDVESGRELFYILNHPIKWVRLVGVVVGVDQFGGWTNSLVAMEGKGREGAARGRVVYTIDDGSGAVVECVGVGPPPPIPKPKPIPTTSTTTKGGSGLECKHTLPTPNPTTTSKTKEQPSITSPSIPYASITLGSILKIKGKPTTYRSMAQVEIIKADVLRGTAEEVRCWDEVGRFRREVLGREWVVGWEEGERLRRKMERAQGRDRRKDGERRGKDGEKEMARRGGERDGHGKKRRDGRDGEMRVKRTETADEKVVRKWWGRDGTG